jgi:hypothetical protein
MQTESIFKRLIILTIFSLLIILISYPRFNRQDLGLLKKITSNEKLEFISDKGVKYTNLSLDSQQYLKLVKYFRNSTVENRKELTVPYCYRPLAPLIASIFPFDEMTSLNLLNVLSLILGLFLLELIIMELGVAGIPKYLALLLYVMSLPTFYYGAIGYIDPFFILLLILGLFILIKKQWIIFPFYIFLSVFGKEGIVILLPVAVAFSIAETKARKKALIGMSLSFAAYILGVIIARILFSSHNQYMWIPSIKLILLNIARVRGYISIVVSFGLPGLFSLLLIKKALVKHITNDIPFFWPLTCGFAMTIIYCIFGLIATYADARSIWPCYVFCVPLTAIYFSQARWLKNKLDERKN